MKRIVDIPDELIKKVKDHCVYPYDVDKICEAILDGTPLPEHHADLIDRDELLTWSHKMDTMYCIYDEVVDVGDIKNAPTIIERSDSE